MALCPGPSWFFAFFDARCRVSRSEPEVVCKTRASPTPDGGTNKNQSLPPKIPLLELFSMACEAKDIVPIPIAPICTPNPHSTSPRARPPFRAYRDIPLKPSWEEIILIWLKAVPGYAKRDSRTLSA